MNRPIKIGFLLTHPIQYFAPFFRELARRPEVELEVFFAHHPTEEEQSVGFGVPFKWNVEYCEERDIDNMRRRVVDITKIQQRLG